MADQGTGAGAPPAVPPSARVAVVLATAAAHATSFAGQLQFDDFAVIEGDARVQSLGAWWASMPGIRPLLKLTYALDHQLGWGLPGQHAVNLAVHVAAALLALALLDRLGRRLRPALPPTAAVVGALLFALHPVQVEAVTYVSGRSSALCGALSLASLLAHVAGRERGSWVRVYLLSPALMVLALGVKEGALAVPPALLLCEALDRRPGRSWRAALGSTAVHWLVLAGGAALLLGSPVYARMMTRSLALRGPLANLLTHAEATLWLAGQLVRPHRLVADPALRAVLAPDAASVAALAALGLLAALALAGLRRRAGGGAAVAGFAVLWFLLWLAPQGWWLPRPEPASERQLYLALLGPAWAAAVALHAVALRSSAVRAGVAALLLALGVVTAVRSQVYRDEVTFWSDVVEKAPHNPRAHANLGWALAHACRPEEAEAALREALRLDPSDVRSAVNLRLLREGVLLGADEAARCAVPAQP
ncbi:MAG: tetratricopeptide repeat protein [Anaeromyxobacter sp.]